MKKKITIITSIVSLVLIVALVITLIVIKTNDNYSYPSETPKVSNPNSVYLQVGDVKITREQMYYRALSNYGLVTINDLIDDILLPDADETSAEFIEYRDKVVSKYLGIEVDELDDEKWNEFYDDMVLQGQTTVEATKKYLLLDYRRYVYVHEQLTNDVANFEPVKDENDEIVQEKYFLENQYETALDILYPEEAQVIVISFRSEQEARYLLDSLGVEINNIYGWLDKTTKAALTKAEVYEKFITMYNLVYNYRGSELAVDGDLNVTIVRNQDDYVKLDHTYTSLAKVSSVIAGKVFNNLSTTKTLIHQYTTAPQPYLSGYYLALKTTSSELTDEEKAEKDDEVLEYLIENAITTTLTNYYLYQLRLNAGVTIFEEGLENSFATSINSALTNLEDFEGFEKTTDTSDTNVVSLTLNDKTVHITADQLCDELIRRYGVQTSISYMNQYIALVAPYSEVYDYRESKILDQELYDEYYTEVTNIKKELEKGTYAANGFSKKYGFENYLRDNFGFMSPLEVLLSGSVYDVAVNSYAKKSYTFSNEYSQQIYNLFRDWYAEIDKENATEADIVQKYDVFENEKDKILKDHPETEYTIQYQIVKMYLEYFNINGFTIGYYVDFDGDLTADDLSERSDLQLIGEELVELLLAKAYTEEVTGDSYSAKLRKLITEYKIADINDQVYGHYKKHGILLNITDASNYTNSNVDNENLKDVLKAKWNRVRDALDFEQDKDGNDTEVKIAFATTSSTITANQALKYTWDAERPSIDDTYYEMNYVYSRFIALSATNATWYSYVKSSSSSVINKVLIPINFQSIIELYNINQKADEEKTAEEIEKEKSSEALQAYQKNWITFFYTPIVQNFEGEDALSARFADARQGYLDDNTFVYTDSNDKALYKKIMDLLLTDD